MCSLRDLYASGDSSVPVTRFYELNLLIILIYFSHRNTDQIYLKMYEMPKYYSLRHVTLQPLKNCF